MRLSIELDRSGLFWCLDEQGRVSDGCDQLGDAVVSWASQYAELAEREVLEAEYKAGNPGVVNLYDAKMTKPS